MEVISNDVYIDSEIVPDMNYNDNKNGKRNGYCKSEYSDNSIDNVKNNTDDSNKNYSSSNCNSDNNDKNNNGKNLLYDTDDSNNNGHKII